MSDLSQWYVQKGSKVQGPFSSREIGRFMLLGRVRSTDRVSKDGELWEPVSQVPELIPEELLDLNTEGGLERLLAARAAVDERNNEVSVIKERRDDHDQILETLKAEWGQQQRDPENLDSGMLPWSLLGITVAALGVVVYFNIAAAA